MSIVIYYNTIQYFHIHIHTLLLMFDIYGARFQAAIWQD